MKKSDVSVSSTFSEKIMHGQVPTDDEWTAHLIEAHKIAPSMTPHAFAGYRTNDGMTSYELLADELVGLREKNATVLDLACGDGYLFQFIFSRLGSSGNIIGVDMSDAELNIAKRQYASDKRIKFYNTRAHGIPVADKTVDAIVCHMAFMLMLPIEPVVAEISRVLKTNGIFTAVIGSNRGKPGLFADILRLTLDFTDSRYPKMKEAKSGDPRVNSEEGLNSLFTKQVGFERISKRSEFELQIRTDANGVWDLMKDMYFISMLRIEEKAQLANELKQFVRAKSDSEGLVSFPFYMTKFVVKKVS
jgi:ubiquinone/menaquinone biosynthesis C-methylase UbiE